MEYVTLNNGVEMSILGHGTYQTPPRITEQCVANALRVGYRSIDTAQCYGNEQEVGLACRKYCKVVPAVNQVETHVFRQQKKLRDLEVQIGTSLFGWW